MKRKLITLMLNFNYIKSLVPKIHKITVSKIENIIKANKPDQEGYVEFNALDLVTSIASTVVFQLFFGGEVNVEELKIKGRTVNDQIRLIKLLLSKQLFKPLPITFG